MISAQTRSAFVARDHALKTGETGTPIADRQHYPFLAFFAFFAFAGRFFAAFFFLGDDVFVALFFPAAAILAWCGLLLPRDGVAAAGGGLAAGGGPAGTC